MAIAVLKHETRTSGLLIQSSSRIGPILEDKETKFVLHDHSLPITISVATPSVNILTSLKKS